MAFNAEGFYQELDRLYGAHDSEGARRLMLETREAVRGDKLAETAVLNELACFYRNTSAWTPCVESFRELLSVMESAGTENTEDYARAVLNMAGAYRLMGDYDSALATFARARDILDKQNAEPYSYASIWNNEGLVYQDMGDFSKAAEYFERGLNILRTIPERSSEYAVNLSNLAAAYFRGGKQDAAIRALDEALSLFSGMEGVGAMHYASALNTKAVMLFSSGNLRESAALFTQAAEQTKLVFGENKDYASACRSCAAVYARLGDAENAALWREKYERAAEDLKNR